MNPAKHHILLRVFLAVGVTCIGFAAIFIRLAGIPGVVSVFYRLLIASVALVPVWLTQKDRWIEPRQVYFAICSGIAFGVDLGLWSSSLFHTPAATSTLLMYLAPIWVTLASIVFLRERQHHLFWAGALLAFGGMIVMVGVDNVLHIRIGYGNTLAISASFFYAGYLFLVHVGRKSTGTLAFTAISVLASMATLFVICLLRGEQMTGFSTATWMYLLALGLVTHVLGWLSLNYALGHMKASVVSVTLLGQPIITALAAIPFLGEPLSPRQIIGGGLVLAGIYLVNRTADSDGT